MGQRALEVRYLGAGEGWEARAVGLMVLGECPMGKGEGWEAGVRVARGWMVGETAEEERGVEVRGAWVEVAS